MTEPSSYTISLLAIYCVLALVASLAGGWLIMLVHLTHTRLQVAISFVAGLMLGMALLHFLPDATEQLHSLNRTVNWMLGGFLVMFFLQRFFHFHHHDLPPGKPAVEPSDHDHDHQAGHHHDHDHQHGHDVAHHPHPVGRRVSWVGIALGLTFHSLLDGLAMAAAVQADSENKIKLAGLGVALAVILHKPFDSMTVSTLMVVSEKSKFFRHLLNALFALVSPLGVLLFYFGASHFADSNAIFLGCALAFCAGTFLCISSSDLLPELQFHSHDRFKLSIALLAGLAIAVIIGKFETDRGENKHAGIEVPASCCVEPGLTLQNNFKLTKARDDCASVVHVPRFQRHNGLTGISSFAHAEKVHTGWSDLLNYYSPYV